MKAAVQHGYGSLDFVQVEEMPRPALEDDEVLVRIHAVSVTLSDNMMWKGRPLAVRLFSGLLRPKRPIQGSEFAGVIDAVGTDVQRFVVGDRVFGATGDDGGCYAEFACVPEGGFIEAMPANMTFEEAAPVCGALAAWNFLREKANVQSGQKVLINGASGSIGTAGIQLASHFGAEVTGVCSTGNLQLIESLGAEKVIDYTREDFTRGSEEYDIILDAESKSSFSRCRGVLTHDGAYLRAFPGPAILLQMLATSLVGQKKALTAATGLLPVPKRLAFLEELNHLFEAGDLRSVVDRCFPLDEIADAYRYSERGHKRGTVVVTVSHDD